MTDKAKRILFTGGGSAGHVIPNLPVIKQFIANNWQVSYIGSYTGIESEIVKKNNIDYYPISTGKLRRYFSWQNFSDPFRIFKGIIDAFVILKKVKPQIIFSKGGFVSVPVVLSAWCLRIPVVAHESDLTPGLANKISYPFVNKICVTFEMAKKSFKNPSKVIVTGTPIRSSLFDGEREKGLALCQFSPDKPTVMIIGGSSGSKRFNEVVRESLDTLLGSYQLIHICGQGLMDESLMNVTGYKQFEFVDEELKDLYAASNVVVSRAGANSVYEVLALQKPHIFIPLPLTASRGDQIQNAAFYEANGISTVIKDEELDGERLIKGINQAYQSSDEIIKKIKGLNIQSATDLITELLVKEQKV